MARTTSVGFELNSTTSQVEYFASAGTPSIQSSVKRSGDYALRINSLASGTRKYAEIILGASVSDTNGPWYIRTYFRVDTLPSATNRIIYISDGGGATPRAGIDLTSTGTLQLRDEDGTIGSPSSALSLNTWYMIEVLFDRTLSAGSHIVRARLDGSEFAAATNRSISIGVAQLFVGGNLNLEAQTVGDWYFDDIAVNDSSGSFQNTYPGDGKIIHLKPNASGDINSFATQTGGTAGAGNNFTRVNEVTPDDATTFNGSSTLNEEDLFSCDDSGLGSSDTINVVSVGGRFRNSTADATAALRFEIEKTGSGTIAQSSSIVPNSTTWRTNTTVANTVTYPITTYQDPDGANWSNTTLDTMQIGYKLQTAPGTGGRRIDVSKVWALVEYVPDAGGSTAVKDTIQSGIIPFAR